MDEEFGSHYTAIRRLLFMERADGLSLALKELLFVMLAAVVGNVAAGKLHLQAARRAGLTRTQLQETLMVVFLETGIGPWGKGGAEIWDGWDEEAERIARP